MVDDRGPEGMREEVERRLGYALPDFALEPLDHDPADHMGVEPEHEPGVSSVGAPVHLGLISGDQMLAVADARRGPRPRHPPDAAAEPRRHRDHGRRRRLERSRGDRLPGRREPPALERDRLHRRAALQLRGRGDEGTARRPDRASRGPLRRRGLRAPPPPRRLPPRLRPALGRRSRLPGHDGSRRGGQAAPGLRHPAARGARPGRGDRPAGVPSRTDRGARRDGRAADRRLARGSHARRELPRRTATARPTTSSAS